MSFVFSSLVSRQITVSLRGCKPFDSSFFLPRLRGGLDQVYVPCQAEFLALQGLSDLVRTIEIVKKRLNSKLNLAGVIVTRYDGRKKLCREVVETLKDHFCPQLFQTYIRENVALAESVSHAQSIFEYAPKSYGAMDYMNLAKEILERQVPDGKKGREKSKTIRP
jgi:cellulose biosynthesis protein BcsQ